MRAIILVLILLVVAAIAAVATGFLNINQTRPAAAPKVDVTNNGVVAKGGQAPAFQIETGKVQVKPPEIQVTPTQDETNRNAAPQRQPAEPARPAPAPAPQGQQVPTTDSTQP